MITAELRSVLKARHPCLWPGRDELLEGSENLLLHFSQLSTLESEQRPGGWAALVPLTTTWDKAQTLRSILQPGWRPLFPGVLTQPGLLCKPGVVKIQSRKGRYVLGKKGVVNWVNVSVLLSIASYKKALQRNYSVNCNVKTSHVWTEGPAELSAVMDVFCMCTVQYGSHQTCVIAEY